MLVGNLQPQESFSPAAEQKLDRPCNTNDSTFNMEVLNIFTHTHIISLQAGRERLVILNPLNCEINERKEAFWKWECSHRRVLNSS